MKAGFLFQNPIYENFRASDWVFTILQINNDWLNTEESPREVHIFTDHCTGNFKSYL